MYVDPITRQTYDFATPIACDSNPRNNIELEPIEPLAPQLARANKKYKCAIDLM